MDFSIMLWGDTRDPDANVPAYDLMLKVAKYADEHDFAALWIPERHFNEWGGLYPNPATVCAALATYTQRIKLRAGSVVVPLHHPVRIAEEWAVVDNLSGGRVEISVASGWRADDFIFAPSAYEQRKQIMFDNLEIVQKLWRGEPYVGTNPSGQSISATIYPRPIQPELPVWVTSSGSLRTMTDAGSGGYSLLTHMLGQKWEDLETKVGQYRAYRVNAGLSGKGRVSLMLHTFIGRDREQVKELVRPAMLKYMAASTEIMRGWENVTPAMRDEMLALAFDRYFDTAGLMGTPSSCRHVVERAAKLGVTDICCLVDFGVPARDAVSALELLTELKDASRAG